MEETIHTRDVTCCIICGMEVDDPNFQLCDKEECAERFRDLYLQV
ncbi:hypothetical protein DNHGIG_19490 [Collibacillus ludicampi]|uniref:Inhibitor of sigma-G Gin n=1 Tax=Collibacillus ludicampi TaxID=2771369 RepID=A0AAV4LEW7_9BACL|nr:hypothetical protein [Collibacillus ludicampi]GIM46400.1 hypothetical protein DNHGIG_19490 [Collibacillus ludicampi]